ncbi:acetylornithine deacetylase [Caldichromatium japonicum]|uniref:Acetylornithine deacetylase n=1 Tax=Caldichromatium japonicum TaxID=2699430 RepID=A0A6G7VA83_9GAMM|nr:acetylornithine deacetylase [Caldichromatium japonicum]QIK36776.1 acetylornithine deacetylase [Caldichromatium japonicum]
MNAPPPLETLLTDLIAIPSVSSLDPALDQGNRPLLERLADWLETAGFQIEMLPIPGYPDKYNLIATLGSGLGGLVLAGHSDTVPYDAARWTYDPFTLTKRDGCYYGLGIADMKSFFALALEAVRGIEPGELRSPLIILATADEESSMRGARALVDAGRPLGRHALIGEPTGLRPVRLHKGVMETAIRLLGQSGHASNPALGHNAIEGMHAVISALLDWRAELKARFHYPAFTIPYPTLNLGSIHGGDNPNRICGQCELQLDLRLLPGLAPETLYAELTGLVSQAAEPLGLSWSIEPLFPPIPPGETPQEAAIVRACESLTGQPAEAVNFGTELPFFNQLGMETVILGPGDIAQAHQPDESLPIERIGPTIALLRALIRRFCIEAASAGQQGLG